MLRCGKGHRVLKAVEKIEDVLIQNALVLHVINGVLVLIDANENEYRLWDTDSKVTVETLPREAEEIKLYKGE